MPFALHNFVLSCGVNSIENILDSPNLSLARCQFLDWLVIIDPSVVLLFIGDIALGYMNVSITHFSRKGSKRENI